MQQGIKTSEKSGEQGKRFLCIHGHFYQTPRENPWIEAIEVEDSAAPYHDWNQRICAECYAPNAHAHAQLLEQAKPWGYRPEASQWERFFLLLLEGRILELLEADTIGSILVRTRERIIVE